MTVLDAAPEVGQRLRMEPQIILVSVMRIPSALAGPKSDQARHINDPLALIHRRGLRSLRCLEPFGLCGQMYCHELRQSMQFKRLNERSQAG